MRPSRIHKISYKVNDKDLVSTTLISNLLLYGYIRLYILNKYSFSHSIPDDIKKMCCNFYRYQYEIFKANTNDIEVIDKSDSTVNLCKIRQTNNNEWSKVYGLKQIDFSQDSIYNWKFKINKICTFSKLRIGIGDGVDNEYVYFEARMLTFAEKMRLKRLAIDNNTVPPLRMGGSCLINIKKNGGATQYVRDGDILSVELCLHAEDKSHIGYYKNKGVIATAELQIDTKEKGYIFIDLMSMNDNVSLISFNYSKITKIKLI